MSGERKSTATLLVELAEELYVFGCIYEQRGHTSRNPGDDPVATYEWAAPKDTPERKRPLAEIRDDLAADYAFRHNKAPNKNALGDAMSVLAGKARKQTPTAADGPTLGQFLAALGPKESLSTQLVRLAEERFRIGVSSTGEVFAVPIDGPNVARPLRGGRRSLRAELAKLYFEHNKAAANAQALADALLVLEGKAQSVEPSELALRVAQVGNALVLDLGGEDGRVVVVRGAGDWDVETSSPVLFWRTNATLPLPEPGYDGTLDPLRALLNIADADWPLLVAWLVCALIADMPHPVLALLGEQGTAKSTAARLLTSLIDPAASQLRTAPRSVEDWCVAAAASWITCLDNVSDLQPWLQDSLCKAVTGDGLLRRQLYSDNDVSVLAFRRVIALTSIDVGALSGDLADRMLSIELERIVETNRLDERAIGAKWTSVHAGVLGGLLHVVSKVMARLEGIRSSDLPRMADYARVLLAVDEVLDTNGYQRYLEQSRRTAERVADSDSLCIAIRAGMAKSWEGTASDLLTLLTPDKPPKDWPTTPQGMGGRLARVAPALRALGWIVEPPDRNKKSRRWTLVHPEHVERYRADMEPTEPMEPDANGAIDSMSAGSSSEDAAPTTCRRCGEVLLLQQPGRDLCEPCRLDLEAGAQ